MDDSRTFVFHTSGAAAFTWSQIRELDAAGCGQNRHNVNCSENKESNATPSPHQPHRVPLLREVLSAFLGRAHLHLVSQGDQSLLASMAICEDFCALAL